MSAVKKSAFSGSWYPDDPKECTDAIKSFLAAAPPKTSGLFSGGIVPHAGWFYSGAIACQVIASLQRGTAVDVIVVFGGHLNPQDPAVLLWGGSVETPLGEIETDSDMAAYLAQGVDVEKKTPDRFPDENTLELQYPFIRYFFPKAKLLACCVPPSALADTIGRTIVQAARQMDLSIRVIGSTDMTHYGPNFGFMPAGTGEKAVQWVRDENDRKGVDALLRMDVDQILSQGLGRQSMCCSGAAAAAAAACRAGGASSGQLAAYATSYEKSKGSSFVGYSGVLYA